MEALDIVKLIEKNSLTRLSKDYESKLINKIKTNFTDTQQQLFVASFYCFLNYDSKKDFVINFDNVWKWIGFSRKDSAKKLLEKHFTIDIDYKVQKLAPPIDGASFEDETVASEVAEASFEDEILHGGQNKEIITLTINTFKKFCMKANTKKADEIHEYYIKLEELLQETVNEETNELRLQLQIKDEENEENEKILLGKNQRIKQLENKILKRQSRLDCDDKNYIYIITTEVHIQDRIYIIGRAVDLPARLTTYNKTMEHNVVYCKSCKSREQMNIIEIMILLKLDKYRERTNRDRFILPLDADISLFTDIVNSAIKWFDDIQDYVHIYDNIDIGLTNEELQQKFSYEIIESEEEIKNKRKEYKKQYRVDNLQKITEADIEYRQDHKEEKSITDKIYRESNKEKILENKKIYYENNKEKILENQKIYYEDNKEVILEKQKEYHENNKDTINQKRKTYRDENKEKISEQKKIYCEKYKDEIKIRNKIYRETLTETITCDCGIILRLCNSKSEKHLNSKAHQMFIKKQKLIE
jgi:hypothetical protein